MIGPHDEDVQGLATIKDSPLTFTPLSLSRSSSSPSIKKRKNLPRGRWISLSTAGDRDGEEEEEQHVEEEEHVEEEQEGSPARLGVPVSGGPERDKALLSPFSFLLVEDLALSAGLTAPRAPYRVAGKSAAGGDLLSASNDPRRDSFNPPNVGRDDSTPSVESVSATDDDGGGVPPLPSSFSSNHWSRPS